MSELRQAQLPEGWESKEFEKCLEKVQRATKIPKKKFLDKGSYPIISQESDFINGYWNGASDVLEIEKPVVIFGDHTKIVKYVDFPFVQGADGVKVLQPINNIDARFFYYQLQSISLADLGYARHYRLLKQETIVIPPLETQKQIVAVLDKAFAAIDLAKANIEKNLQNAKELFQSKLNQIFTQKGEGWEEKKLGDSTVCFKIFAGGDAPRENFSKIRTEKYNIPIYANAVKNNGLYGFTDNFRVSEPSITVAGRGSGTGHTEIRYEPFLPIVRLIVLIPNTEMMNLEYLKYSIQSRDLMRSGSAIPQLTVPMIKEHLILCPPLIEQEKIVEWLNQLSFQTSQLKSTCQQKLENLDELKKSILQKAFVGEL